jgi:hypothetical protein
MDFRRIRRHSEGEFDPSPSTSSLTPPRWTLYTSSIVAVYWSTRPDSNWRQKMDEENQLLTHPLCCPSVPDDEKMARIYILLRQALRSGCRMRTTAWSRRASPPLSVSVVSARSHDLLDGSSRGLAGLPVESRRSAMMCRSVGSRCPRALDKRCLGRGLIDILRTYRRY